MPDHPRSDILSRYRARHQISEEQYKAGRRWQALDRAAEGGDLKAKEILDGLDLGAKWSLGWVGHELLRDVLGGPADAPGSSKLAQAAAKRGLNPTTSSRHMKALGHKFRQSLSKLAEELDEYFAADREAKQIERKLIWRDVHRAPGLGGVQVSTPASDKFDREIEHVQSLALARGFRVDRTTYFDDNFDDGEGFDVFTPHGVLVAENRPLTEIEARLLNTPVKRQPAPKRKRGAYGRAPVTLARTWWKKEFLGKLRRNKKARKAAALSSPG